MSNLKTQNHNENLKSEKNNNVRYRAFKFSLAIINFISNIKKNQILSVIFDQLLRLSTSVGANLVEAKSSSSKKDFIHFYEIALKSANETLYWLLVLKESQLINKEKVKPLISEIKEISNMIAGSLLTMKNKK
ncbi:MAG: four helix bundle protein [Patescibacteria group bacterium]|nr:four helix bundle protein [Patescibacteria group bacterium]